jgi:hypothetical protein
MATRSIQIQIRKNLFPKIAATFPAEVQAINDHALDQIIAIADPLTPVKTGALKAHKHKTKQSVVWEEPYAGFVDKGTVHMAPRLFATTAGERVRPQWVRELAAIESRLG